MRLFGEGRRRLLKWTPDAHNEMERVVNEVYAALRVAVLPIFLEAGYISKKVMMDGPEHQELNIEGRRMARLAFDIMRTPNP